MPENADTIEILTLNCWGLKYISQLTTQRIEHISNELSLGTSDIVCLQEIWQEKHWLIIKQKVKGRLPYSKFFFSGMMGSGLAILSKYPIVQTDMRPYTLNGRPQAFFRGDWFVGKGVASAVIELPGQRLCQVFNTHMHAPYNERVDTYLCHRIAQAWELHKILEMSVRAGYITFATGDFNSVPGSLVHRFLTTHLSDSFLSIFPDLPLLPPTDASVSPLENITVFGTTCDVSPINTWRQSQAPGMMAKRLDYVFHDDQAKPLSIEVVFTDPVPSVHCSASDHFGVRCSYELSPSSAKTHRPLRTSDYEEMELMVNWYVNRETSHSQLRIFYFWLSLGLLVALLLALRTSIAPTRRLLLGICLVLLTISCVLSGLIGAVFGWWELRGLAEFSDEIQRAKHRNKK